MVEVLQASQLTLYDVEAKFGLQPETNPDFFPEWQTAPIALSDYQRQVLDQAQASCRYLMKYLVQEALIKLVIVSPLLSVAGFYQKPFCTVAEQPTKVAVEDEDEIIRGRIDVLVVNEQLWVAVIEAKGSHFSWSVGLPQTLTYMTSGRQRQERFGLITNGSNFMFVKLQETGRYRFSKEFSLYNPGNDLYAVVSVLKSISQQTLQGNDPI
ncbi:MAG: restriction endonuclease subunit R [Phormidesmis sp.]